MTQGKVTNKIADLLMKDGWSILYKCIPNTIHIGVVPIPIKDGTTRYPDIVAYKNRMVKLIEVEPVLNQEISQNLAYRLNEQRTALNDQDIRTDWVQSLVMKTGVNIDIDFAISCELVVMKVQKDCDFLHEHSFLHSNQIVLYTEKNYENSILD